MIVIEERNICRMLEGLFQFDKECEWNDAIEEAMHRFVNLPTIEAEPVIHGKWMFSPDHAEGICTMCNFKIYGRPYNNTYLIVPYNFCPNCGAKMDGGESDERSD